MLPEDIWVKIFQASDLAAIAITGAFAFLIGKIAELLDYPPRRVMLFELLSAMAVGVVIAALFGWQQGFGVPVEIAKGVLIYSTGGAVASQLVALSPLGKVFGRAVAIAPPPTALPPLAPVDHLADAKDEAKP